ncbi:MAG TPA: hypothetical protein VGE35_00160 [Candidatus Paceibacterota bacterium]
MCRPYATVLTAVLSIAIVAVFALSPDVVYAQAQNQNDSGFWLDIGTGIVNAFANSFGKLFQTFFEVVILPLSSGIMRLTGAFLDAMIKFSISTSYIFNNLSVINQVWTVVRDLCNLFFIFALIWMSISTILGIGEYDAKRKLIHVILAALIINFSLFFTKVLVDLSNIFATWIYGGILASLQANGTDSLSALISDRLGIAALWNLNIVSNLINPSQGIITAVIRLIVLLAATYVFAYTSIMFITRAVTIIFLLALSPIGFIGDLLPQLRAYSEEWREELTSALSFPIVYLLMLYITVQFVNALTMTGVIDGLMLTFGTNNSIFGLSFGDIFKYFIVVSMLFICLEVAKKTSGKLGESATGIAKMFAGISTAIGGKAAALTGQFTVGAAAKRFSENKWLNQKVAEGSILASAAKGGAGSIADFHFDPRVAMNIGVKGGKGYKSMMKEFRKEQEEAMEAIAPSAKEMAPAKAQLDEAEHEAYMAHPTLSAVYDDMRYKERAAKERLKIVSAEERTQAFKEHEKAKAELDKVKTAMREDTKYKTDSGEEKDWNFNEKLHEMQEIELKKATEALNSVPQNDTVQLDKAEKIVNAIKAARRQQEAIKNSKDTLSYKLAKSAAGKMTDKEKAERGLLGAIAAKASGADLIGSIPEYRKRGKIGKALGIVTGVDLIRAAAAQTVEEGDKTAKALGEAKAKPEKKKQNSKIEGILQSLANDASAPAPAPGPGPTK